MMKRWTWTGPAGLLVALLAAVPALAQTASPEGGPAAGAEDPWLQEVTYLITPDQRQQYLALTSEKKKASFQRNFWQRLVDGYNQDREEKITTEQFEKQYRSWLEYARTHFAEGDTPGWLSERGCVFMYLSPPLEIKRDTVDWTGRSEELDQPPADLEDLKGRFNQVSQDQGETAASSTTSGIGGIGQLGSLSFGSSQSTGKLSLTGAHPTEFWIYWHGDQKRVITFVDLEGTGRYRYVRDRFVPKNRRIRPQVESEMLTQFYQTYQMDVAAGLPDLPAVEGIPFPIKVRKYFLKAGENKTQASLVVGLDLTTMTRLGLDAAYLEGATLFLRLTTPDDAPILQVEKTLAEEEVIDEGGQRIYSVAFPQLPGTYKAKLVVAGADNRGAGKNLNLKIPSMFSRLILSTPVLAEHRQIQRRAGASDDPEERLPFQFGNRIIYPRLSGQFDAGESVDIFFQVYNYQEETPDVTITAEIYFEGSYQGDLDTMKISRKNRGNEFLIQYPITGQHPNGKYEVRLAAEDKHTGETAESKIKFKVKHS